MENKFINENWNLEAVNYFVDSKKEILYDIKANRELTITLNLFRFIRNEISKREHFFAILRENGSRTYHIIVFFNHVVGNEVSVMELYDTLPFLSIDCAMYMVIKGHQFDITYKAKSIKIAPYKSFRNYAALGDGFFFNNNFEIAEIKKEDIKFILSEMKDKFKFGYKLNLEKYFEENKKDEDSLINNPKLNEFWDDLSNINNKVKEAEDEYNYYDSLRHDYLNHLSMNKLFEIYKETPYIYFEQSDGTKGFGKLSDISKFKDNLEDSYKLKKPVNFATPYHEVYSEYEGYQNTSFIDLEEGYEFNKCSKRFLNNAVSYKINYEKIDDFMPMYCIPYESSDERTKHAILRGITEEEYNELKNKYCKAE